MMKLQKRSLEKLEALRACACHSWTYVDEGEAGHFVANFPFSLGFVKNHPELFTISEAMDDASALRVREVILTA